LPSLMRRRLEIPKKGDWVEKPRGFFPIEDK
jgi:hypothetical protein